MTKRELRARVRAACPDAETLAAESRAVCEHILQSEEYRKAQTIAAYLPMRGEADIRQLLKAMLCEGKNLLLPRTNRDLTMSFCAVTDLERLVSDAYGIPAPPEDAEEADPDSIELMLLPLCAVDSAGNRLGKGGGCYDRWLAAHPSHAVRMGVALSCQRVDTVSTDPWDTRLDACAFPDGIVRYE